MEAFWENFKSELFVGMEKRRKNERKILRAETGLNYLDLKETKIKK